MIFIIFCVPQAELKAVSPSEDFTCSLGVDPGLRVVYKPVYKYREQSGLLTKSVVTTYKQVYNSACISPILIFANIAHVVTVADPGFPRRVANPKG